MPDSVNTEVGTLVRDPDLRFLAGGSASCSFDIAVNHRYKKGGSTEWTEEVMFLTCVAYGSLAENISSSCAKGTRVIVHGRLHQRSWEDNATGTKRTAIELLVEECAPSLRWATALVERNPRKGDS
jgi:single-strand DNA-binding protein